MKKVLGWGIRGTLTRGEVFGGIIFWACLGLALVLLGGSAQAKGADLADNKEEIPLAETLSDFEKKIKPKYQNLGSGNLKLPKKKDNRQIFYESLLLDYPLGEMSEELAQLPEDAAAYVIAIAKKESQWGRRAPSKNGQDCFNYWGYKGASEEQVMGYSCFTSRQEAVEKVGARIQKLLDNGLDTPEKFIVWKCGRSCSGHDPQGVAKWISDVKGVLKSLKS